MKITKTVLGLLSISMMAGTVLGADLPKVLIIGDSISMGYTPVVTEKLKDVADVSHPISNCEFTGYGLENMKSWLGTNKWAVIHFNFGIWDTHLLRAGGALVTDESKPEPGTHIRYTPEQYGKNLTKIVEILQATGAKLVWASTTPVMARKGKRFEAIITDNEVAAKIMQEHKIPIDDLYTYVLPNVKGWQSTDGCHFDPVGNQQIANKVAESIQQALSGAKSK